MRVLMEIRRTGSRYAGSLTRVSDQRSLPFDGILELLAVLERLELNDHGESDAMHAGDDGGSR
jgi:hypothetical protein